MINFLLPLGVESATLHLLHQRSLLQAIQHFIGSFLISLAAQVILSKEWIEQLAIPVSHNEGYNLTSHLHLFPEQTQVPSLWL